jgi:UDPglucose 6-dehydrogenase
MKLCVIGTGYVGLVAGTCFAETGNEVICVDKDANKIELLLRGEVPIYEPGLEELIRRNSQERRLTFTTDLEDAVKRSIVCFIAVGTPLSSSGKADLAAVWSVAHAIAQAADGYRIVVLKSTVPVGTTASLRKDIASWTSHEIDVAANPEFLKEGAAIEDFLKPDRVVIGVDNPSVAAILTELYEPFVRTANPIIKMDTASAEMTKYASNAFLATKISFINEMAHMCELVGADIEQVRRGVGHDRRIGHHFLFAGVGYGGSCFPKDVKALVANAAELGMDFTLLRAVEEINERQKRRMIEKVVAEYGQNLSGRRFAVWGLSFKPRTDDMREAPSLTIIEALLVRGASVAVHDPEAIREARKYFGTRVMYHQTSYDALRDADALLVLTEWNEFRRPDFARIKQCLRRPIIFDGRNIYDPVSLKELGFTYVPIGRQKQTS